VEGAIIDGNVTMTLFYPKDDHGINHGAVLSVCLGEDMA